VDGHGRTIVVDDGHVDVEGEAEDDVAGTAGVSTSHACTYIRAFESSIIKESKEEQVKMNPENESTYFCRVWTPPYSSIIYNPAGNPTPTSTVIKIP